MGAICRQKMQIVHLNRKVGNNVGTVWKRRAVWWNLILSLCSQERSGESETGSQQGAPSSFFPSLLLHTPPTPAPPLGTCLFPEFLFLSYSIHSFLFFFLSSACLPSHPSFSYVWLTLAPPLSLASGPTHNQQHAWDSLHCLACFHMTPRKLTICIQSFSSVFLLCTPFVMLFDSISLLPFLCYYDEAPSAFTSDFLSWIWRLSL